MGLEDVREWSDLPLLLNFKAWGVPNPHVIPCASLILFPRILNIEIYPPFFFPVQLTFCHLYFQGKILMSMRSELRSFCSKDTHIPQHTRACAHTHTHTHMCTRATQHCDLLWPWGSQESFHLQPHHLGMEWCKARMWTSDYLYPTVCTNSTQILVAKLSVDM